MMLNDLRTEIDKIDLQMKDFFKQRMMVAEKVAEFKAKTGDKILKPEREQQVIQKLTKDIDKEIKLEYSSFIKKVMEVSRTYQYKKILQLGNNFHINYSNIEPLVKKVCYQGLPSSYSEITASIMFMESEKYSVNTFEDVFYEINCGKADLGIVPLENTTAGNVNEVYDLLLKYDLYINYSYITKVNHCLAGINGADLEDIREVNSHSQAICQCEEFLKSKGITSKESSNTAVAAKYVAEQMDKSIGAICSKEAADRYGLKILAEEINHNKKNATKFVAISKNLIVNENHNRIAIVFSCPHTSGSLVSVLGIFADYGVNLTEIYSRPDRKNSWEYLFYVSFTGNLMDESIKALIFQLYEELPLIKILGSYECDL